MTSGVKETLFVGVLVTSNLKSQLERCHEAFAYYYKDNDPMYLQSTSIEGKQFLGKSVDQGLSIGQLEDTARSVRSMLLKVAPEYRLGENSIKVFAQTFIGA